MGELWGARWEAYLGCRGQSRRRQMRVCPLVLRAWAGSRRPGTCEQQHAPCRWRRSVWVLAMAKESGCTDPPWVSWHLQWTVRARRRPECTGPRGVDEMLETAQEGRHPWPFVNAPSDCV